LTRKDLLKSLTRLGLKERQAGLAVDAFFNTIVTALLEEKKVSIVGLGTWEWRKRRARLARNPKTGKRVPLPARKVLFFKPAPLFKKRLKD
jgi:integration host factor subunit beta